MVTSTTQRRIILLVVLPGGLASMYRWWSAKAVVADESAVAVASDFVPSTQPGKFSFLALGDSYTIGEGVAVADRWPMQTAAAVRAGGTDLADPAILARTGWTTGDLLAAMDATPLAQSYDCVTLMIGVNNQFQHRPLAEFREEFQTLLDRSIKLAGGKANRVIVLSIPDWGVTKFAAGMNAGGVSADIDRFNAAAEELTKKAGASWVDVTPTSRQATKDDASFAADGLHPSAKQYTAWTKLVAQAIETAMK